MSYAPPPNDAVVLSGSPGYSPPSNDAVDLSPLVQTTIERTGVVGAVSLAEAATGDADLEQPAPGDTDNSEDS